MAQGDGREKLMAMFAAIKADPRGKELFGADPVGYLKSKGIDTEGLSFSPTGEVTDADLAMVAGGGCHSGGYYYCYSEG
jgi:hypothetical protein